MMLPTQNLAIFIREQDPLKQGLKHTTNHSITEEFVIQNIREQDPLKQGLKQLCKGTWAQVEVIREQDPLKQGLKL